MVNGRRDNAQPLGICQRFLKLLMSNLFGRGIKHITLGGRESVEVPIEAPSRNGRNSVLKPSAKSNGEIVIDFRHIEPTSNKNGNLAATEKTDASRFGGNHHKGRPPTATLAQESAVRNMGGGKNDTEKDIINGRKPADKETMTMAPGQSLRPLLMKAPSNINEKADDFIRSRKEAMNKHFNSSYVSVHVNIMDN